MNFVSAILEGLQGAPDAPRLIDAVGGHSRTLDGHTVYRRVMALGAHLQAHGVSREATVGIVMGNSADWVVADLACLVFGYTTLPLPLGFSRYQAEFLAEQCGAFLVDAAGQATLQDKWALDTAALDIITVEEATGADLPAIEPPRSHDPAWVCKVIHTSGTTSRPKGVKQSLRGLDVMLRSLLERVPAPHHQHYLSLVPMSLLIEQVTAVYLPLLSGGTVRFLPQGTPLIGEPGCDLSSLLDSVRACNATAMTVPPAMLEVIEMRIARDPGLLEHLRKHVHITTGGAPVDARRLQRLQDQGLSVHEGYGLSENGSVICVSTPQARRIGSVGRPLAHVQVRINDQQHIEISSPSLFLGYSWVDPSACTVGDDGWLDTGDIGRLDDDGYLYVSGRAKNLLCLPNGRNVSPEPVELAFRAQPGVTDAVLLLDSHQVLTVVLAVGNDFDPVATRQWANQWFSDVEAPQAIVTWSQDDARWQSMHGKPPLQRRRLLQEALDMDS
ncbi:AMP-binding protein [Enterobacterales bacterium AW_CKDN230030176-1A_HGKHYDSX7]